MPDLRPLRVTDDQLDSLAEIGEDDVLAAQNTAERDQSKAYATLLFAIILGMAISPAQATTPQFRWDDDVLHFVISINGRTVPNTIVRSELDRITRASSLRMKALAESLRTGGISLAEWQTAMMGEIKSVHLAAGAFEQGGWQQMASRDFGRVGRVVRDEYDFLRNFANQIASGQQPLDGTLGSRAALYGQQGRHTFYEFGRATAVSRGFDEERSVLGQADHCEGCVDEDAAGWRPVGEMIPIGERVCKANCHCAVQWRNSQTGEVLAR